MKIEEGNGNTRLGSRRFLVRIPCGIVVAWMRVD